MSVEQITKLSLELDENDYIINGVKKGYDYEIETGSMLFAKMDIYGIFVLVAFVELGSSKAMLKDEDYFRAIFKYSSVSNQNKDKELFVKLQQDIVWFWEFCNGNWDNSGELLEKDEEIQKRFKAFLPTWWKIVCELFSIKFKSKTGADWLAKKREDVGIFLESGVEKGEINEATYIASYNNYKTAYEFCEEMLENFKQIKYSFAKTILVKNYTLDTDDINYWNVISKSTIIYDRENNFHFVLRGKMCVIKNKTILDFASTC